MAYNSIMGRTKYGKVASAFFLFPFLFSFSDLDISFLKTEKKVML